MRERVDLKSPVRENRPPGSVRGAPGNRRPYLDRKSKRPKLELLPLDTRHSTLDTWTLNNTKDRTLG